MVEKKRWGNKYEDKRDWKSYNAKLVKRGEYYINPKFLGTWLDEVKEMNLGKVGQPYLFPKSMIEFLAVLHAKGFDYRALEGVMRALSKSILPFPVISYSQIWRRVNKLDLSFDVDSNDLVVGVDGSGFKVSNRGDWIRKKWKVQRGWIKVVIMGSLDGKIVDIRVSNEDLDERKAGRGMLRKNRVSKVFMDGLHDCGDTFNLCDKRGVEPVIKVRKDASTRARGSPVRRKCVVEFKRLGYQGWCQERCYGLRWLCTEGIFSAVKRVFGEGVRSSKKRNAYKEVRRKFWAYNRLLNAGIG